MSKKSGRPRPTPTPVPPVPYRGSKINRVRVVKVTPLADDVHVLALEAEVQGPLPTEIPLEVTPDAPEPHKRTFWQWLFGEL